MTQYKVTSSIDSLDPSPEVDIFDYFHEAEDFICDAVSQRVDHIIQHSPYPISQDEWYQIEENEQQLFKLEEV